MTVAEFEEMRAAHVDGFHMAEPDIECFFCMRDTRPHDEAAEQMVATHALNRRLVEENAELIGQLVVLRTERDAAYKLVDDTLEALGGSGHA